MSFGGIKNLRNIHGRVKKHIVKVSDSIHGSSTPLKEKEYHDILM